MRDEHEESEENVGASISTAKRYGGAEDSARGSELVLPPPTPPPPQSVVGEEGHESYEGYEGRDDFRSDFGTDTGADFGAHAVDTDVFYGNQLIVGRYRLEEPLGQGGMGLVAKAKCLRLGKHFAIKRMHRDFASNTLLRELFYREAKLASSLSHPNVISVVDFGEDPAFGAFMVMELAEGDPLSLRMQHGRLPLRTTCEILLQIADALHYIHGQGIVHGDIKPENILLSRVHHSDRRRWNVMLLDFGLARVNHTERRETSGVTGSPPYLAPERIRGESPNPLQDLYSLGVLAYQLVTGHLPFDGRLEEVIAGHLHNEPPPFSDFLDEEMDERVEQLIRKALAKDPQARHADMAAFIYEIRTAVEMMGIDKSRARFKKPVTLVPVQPGMHSDSALAALGFEACPLPVAVLDGEGTIGAANLAFARFIGGAGGESLKGRSVFTARVREYCPDLADDLASVSASGEGATRHLRIATGGASSTLQIGLAPCGDAPGHVLMLVQALRDGGP